MSTAAGPQITVITVTRRPEYLSRFTESVRQQTYQGPVRHLIVIDDKPEVLKLSRSLGMPPDNVVLIPRQETDRDGPGRLSALRNLAVSMAGPTWLAFLDDDNLWEPEHLETLWTAITEQGADIAHSQRQLFEEDGRPYLREEFPWGRDEATRRAIYAYCLEAGIMSRRSNVVRDRLEMRFTWVDLGEWLFPPGFLIAHPFETDYGPWEWFNITVEDKALPKAIYTSGLRVVGTQQPTLHYYLGGYTNTFEGDGVIWHEPGDVNGRAAGWRVNG